MNLQVLEDKLVLDSHKKIIKITKTIRIIRITKTIKTTEIIDNKNSTMNLN
jgi:hypothetical protein